MARVEEKLTRRLASIPAAAPDTTAEGLVQIDAAQEVVDRTAVNLTGTQSDFSSSSIALGAKIASSVKEMVWGDQFVEFWELLDSKDRDSVNGGGKKRQEKSGDKVPEFLPFDLWAKAWNRFQAVMSQQRPELGPDLAHHYEMVVRIKEKNGNWAFYDREFRQLTCRGEAS